jgi:hypothetical protein
MTGILPAFLRLLQALRPDFSRGDTFKVNSLSSDMMFSGVGKIKAIMIISCP